ncbi:MAG: hypothetical protein SFW35_12740 [Chitinophagales bacterium]|nr:hypothetical protein [Chitinophagales bacterium]
MATIIALYGTQNSGKSSTIKILRDLLPTMGFVPVPDTLKWYGGDFVEIYSKAGRLLGLTSAGDTEDILDERLQELFDGNCDVMVCTCRTKGQTTDYLEDLHDDHDIEYIGKSSSGDGQKHNFLNDNDAHATLRRVIQVL